MHYSATMNEVAEAVVTALAETGRAMTVDELSARLGVYRGTVEVALSRLEARGRVRSGPAVPARTWVLRLHQGPCRRRADLRVSDYGHVVMGGRRYGYVVARMPGQTRRERKAEAARWIADNACSCPEMPVA